MCSLYVACERRSAWLSVLIEMNSTLFIPDCTMRLMAFPPPPPTPTTLIETTFSLSLAMSKFINIAVPPVQFYKMESCKTLIIQTRNSIYY